MSALTYGVADFAGGFATKVVRVAVTLFATQSIGLVIAVGLVSVSNQPMPSTAALAWAGAAGLSGIVGIAFFYVALARGTMGFVAPVAALIGAALPALVGVVNGQAATPILIIGMGVALTSVVLISLPSPTGAGRRADIGRSTSLAELVMILGAGLGFAGFYLSIDQSSLAGGDPAWQLLLVRVVGLAIASTVVATLVARGARGSLRVPLAVLPLLLVTGIGDIAGNGFFIAARASGPAPVAVVLSSLYPVATVLLARAFLHERLHGLRLVGVGFAIAGVVLIAAGQAASV